MNTNFETKHLNAPVRVLSPNEIESTTGSYDAWTANVVQYYLVNHDGYVDIGITSDPGEGDWYFEDGGGDGGTCGFWVSPALHKCGPAQETSGG